ncbi:uncharacterized protein LTR77_011047 [Saxophila tyrrhenica]|uniref:Uncharacterized protein n=1 Tax=Saxophila tyrrhenica TaxID=1690608 RepID=A0AAV9NTS1_9PEZI|nr:hypothetical protein LTR77_011047 [Saxophila tyrrhenica]
MSSSTPRRSSRTSKSDGKKSNQSPKPPAIGPLTALGCPPAQGHTSKRTDKGLKRSERELIGTIDSEREPPPVLGPTKVFGSPRPQGHIHFAEKSSGRREKLKR